MTITGHGIDISIVADTGSGAKGRVHNHSGDGGVEIEYGDDEELGGNNDKRNNNSTDAVGGEEGIADTFGTYGVHDEGVDEYINTEGWNGRVDASISNSVAVGTILPPTSSQTNLPEKHPHLSLPSISC